MAEPTEPILTPTEPNEPSEPTPTPTETMPAPTYHIDIWTNPPSYVCTLCLPTQRYTLEDVTAHLREVHHCEAIPTPNMEQLLQLRYDADARAAAEAAQAPTPGPPPPAPAVIQEATPVAPALEPHPGAPAPEAIQGERAPAEESTSHA